MSTLTSWHAGIKTSWRACGSIGFFRVEIKPTNDESPIYGNYEWIPWILLFKRTANFLPPPAFRCLLEDVWCPFNSVMGKMPQHTIHSHPKSSLYTGHMRRSTNAKTQNKNKEEESSCTTEKSRICLPRPIPYADRLAENHTPEAWPYTSHTELCMSTGLPPFCLPQRNFRSTIPRLILFLGMAKDWLLS